MYKKITFILLCMLLLLAIPVSAADKVHVAIGKACKKEISVSSTYTIKVRDGKKAVPASSVKFSSSAPKVVAVNKSGKIKPKKTGKAVITIRYKKKKATLTLNVISPVMSVEINRSSLVMEVGEKRTLTAKVRPNNAAKNVKWTSSDSSVVSVSEGKLTAKKVGTAVIKASVGEMVDSCTVKVIEADDEEEKPKDQADVEDTWHVTVHGVTFDVMQMKETLYIYGDTPECSTRHNYPDNTPAESKTIRIQCGPAGIGIVPDQAINPSDITFVVNNNKSQGIDNSTYATYINHRKTATSTEYIVPDWAHACAQVICLYDSTTLSKYQISIAPLWTTGDFDVAIYYKNSLVRKTHVYIMRPDTKWATGQRKMADFVEERAWENLPANCSLYEKVKAASKFIEKYYTYDEIDCKEGAMLLAWICLDLEIPGLQYWFKEAPDIPSNSAAIGASCGVPAGHTALIYTDPETGENLRFDVQGYE